MTIRNQFQAVVRNLTRRMPVPKPEARRKQSEDTDQAFALATTHFMRRAFLTAAAQTAGSAFLRTPLDYAVTDFIWDAFDWLHLWESNDEMGFQESCEHFDAAAQKHLSLHL